jgi:excisionase family DNA binding protein
MSNYDKGSYEDGREVDSSARSLPRLGYTVKEACEIIGLGETTLRKALKAGELGCVRIGWRVLITLDQMNEFVRKKEVRRFQAQTRARQILKGSH